MSTFWIDDLEDLAKLLPELNRRMDIIPGSDYFPEESATVLVDAHRKDSHHEVIVITAEKSANKDGSDWRQRITLEWNMDYQTVDELVYDLKRLMDMDQDIAKFDKLIKEEV